MNKNKAPQSAAGKADSSRWVYSKDAAGTSMTELQELQTLGFDHIRQAIPLFEHQHPGCYEFVFIEKGKASWDIQDTIYETRAGDVFHAKPYELHRGKFNVIEPCRFWWLILEAPGNEGWLGLSTTESRLVGEYLRQLPRVTATGMLSLAPLQKLRRAIGRKDPLRAIEARLALLEIFMLLLRPEAAGSVAEDLQIKLKQLTDEMSARPEWRPTVGELAAAIGVSPSHFYRTFREYTGMTPISYMDRIRIAEAGRLLQESAVSITQLSLELGFQSSQHFATMFKRFTGATPTAWRNSGNR